MLQERGEEKCIKGAPQKRKRVELTRPRQSYGGEESRVEVGQTSGRTKMNQETKGRYRPQKTKAKKPEHKKETLQRGWEKEGNTRTINQKLCRLLEIP